MSNPMRRKIALVGGGGVRTPLVVFGINEAAEALGAEELVLFDPDWERVRIMAELGRAIVAREGGRLRVRQATSIEDAIEGASFVLNSIRVGGMRARAHDERTSIAHGYPGQETTGPGGVAPCAAARPAENRSANSTINAKPWPRIARIFRKKAKPIRANSRFRTSKIVSWPILFIRVPSQRRWC